MDDDTLRQLQRVHGAALLLYFERRCEPPEDAALLLNDLLIVMWRRAASAPRDPEQVRMWMFGIARKVLLNHARANRRRSALAMQLGDEIALREERLPAEDLLVVRAAIDSLPSVQRELVRLVHWDGFSLVEAAQITGVSASTARSRYALARQRLARDLATLGEQSAPGSSTVISSHG